MPNWLPKMLYEFSAPSGNVWGPHPSILWPIRYNYAAAAKLLQSCLTLGDPIDSSPPGSPIPGILQARTLEWVAISFSNAWKWKVKVKSLSRARLLATPWTAAYQAPLSMGFSRQEYWSGVPLPSPRYNYIEPFINVVWVTQSCRTLCDPMDCSPPGSSVNGILQARILQWVAILFSKGIFLTQGSNPGLLHCRQILYLLSHQESPGDKRFINT